MHTDFNKKHSRPYEEKDLPENIHEAMRHLNTESLFLDNYDYLTRRLKKSEKIQQAPAALRLRDHNIRVQ